MNLNGMNLTPPPPPYYYYYYYNGCKTAVVMVPVILAL